MLKIENKLKKYLIDIVASWGLNDLNIEISTPRSKEYGDISTNIALKLAKP